MTLSQKELNQRAASLQSKSIADLVIAITTQAAAEIVLTGTRIKLSDKASQAFVEALLNPKTSTPAFHSARARHAEPVESPD